MTSYRIRSRSQKTRRSNYYQQRRRTRSNPQKIRKFTLKKSRPRNRIRSAPAILNRNRQIIIF